MRDIARRDMTRKSELIAVFLVIALYTFLAFFQLGDLTSIESFTDNTSAQTAEILFEEPVSIHRTMTFLGVYPSIQTEYRFYLGDSLVDTAEPELKNVFSWHETNLDVTADRVRFTIPANSMLGEVGFQDPDGNLLIPSTVSPGAEKLFDEQQLVPERRTYMNSFYFDEIYHGRTAYELIHNISIYEWTHPPLGKLIITLGVLMFGAVPFGFRFMGALFGVLMLPVMYAFAKEMFRSSKAALFCMCLMAFDFMHFTQTRIATVDSYITFFAMCSYFFMYKHLKEEDSLGRSLRYFALSGVFFGLAACVKWTGIFAGLGLFVIFVISLFQKRRQYITRKWYFWRYVRGVVLTGICFFLLVPAALYYLCYLPVFRTTPWIQPENFLEHQVSMYHYHSDLTEGHPYASPWWSWPLMVKPIFYYQQDFGNGVRAGMSSFGNPTVWWGGLIAFVMCIFYAIRDRDRKAWFLCLGYFLSFIPWAFISRVAFIYHYFPMTVFLILMLGYIFQKLPSYKAAAAYIAVSAALFVLFYPVISGIPVPVWYVDTFLRWINFAF